MALAESEKITINLLPVDLGQIDLLVEQGFYSNRTDFIRIAIRNQLQSHNTEVKDYASERFFVMGVLKFNKQDLEELAKREKQLELKLIGALIVSEDVSLELAKQTFGKVKIFGTIKAPQQVKQFIQRLGKE